MNNSDLLGMLMDLCSNVKAVCKLGLTGKRQHSVYTRYLSIHGTFTECRDDIRVGWHGLNFGGGEVAVRSSSRSPPSITPLYYLVYHDVRYIFPVGMTVDFANKHAPNTIMIDGKQDGQSYRCTITVRKRNLTLTDTHDEYFSRGDEKSTILEMYGQRETVDNDAADPNDHLVHTHTIDWFDFGNSYYLQSV